MAQEFMLDTALKAQQWERANGELRALVALQGSYTTRAVGDERPAKWERLEQYINNFIKHVEDNALQE